MLCRREGGNEHDTCHSGFGVGGFLSKTRNTVTATEQFYLAQTRHAKISGAFLFALYTDIYES